MRHLYSPLPFLVFFCFGHPRRVVPQPGSEQGPAELASPRPHPSWEAPVAPKRRGLPPAPGGASFRAGRIHLASAKQSGSAVG